MNILHDRFGRSLAPTWPSPFLSRTPRVLQWGSKSVQNFFFYINAKVLDVLENDKTTYIYIYIEILRSIGPHGGNRFS